MSLIMIKTAIQGKKGFTLAEILIAALIGTLVITSAWAVYVMIWQWWAETNPRLNVERKARIILLRVIEGVPDSTTGSYTVGSTTYNRRNGIAWASGDPDIYEQGGTLIPGGSVGCVRGSCTDTDCVGVKIKYRIDKPGETSNIREFYVDSYNGRKAVYYKDGNGTSHRIDETLADDIALTFERLSVIRTGPGSSGCNFICEEGLGTKKCLKNVIVVSVTVTDKVYGTRTTQPYTVAVMYTDTVALRNVQGDWGVVCQ